MMTFSLQNVERAIKSGRIFELPVGSVDVEMEPDKDTKNDSELNKSSESALDSDDNEEPTSNKNPIPIPSPQNFDSVANAEIVRVFDQIFSMKIKVVDDMQPKLKEYYRLESEILRCHNRIMKYKGSETKQEKQTRNKFKLDIICSQIRKRFSVSNHIILKSFFPNFFQINYRPFTGRRSQKSRKTDLH